MKRNDVVGYLVLKERFKKDKRAYWNCNCTLCGNSKDMREDTLKNGKTISCGCYNKSEEKSKKMKQIHPIEDLTGNVYHELTVLYLSDKRVNKKIMWTCLCSCGKIVDVWSANLKNGNSKTCGDYEAHRKNKLQEVWENNLTDLSGMTFGYWFVEKRDVDIQPTRWICKCLNCGTVKSVLGNALKKGQSTSCGCTKHNPSLVGQTIGLWNVISRSSRIRPNGYSCTTYLCRCKNCNTERYVDETRLMRKTSLGCGCTISSGVKYIVDILNQNHIKHTTEYKFKNLNGPGNRPLRFDIAILKDDNELVCLIEYNGMQHYNAGEFGKIQREITDPQKKEYCRSNNISLFEIKYNDNLDEKIDAILTHIAC